jgi:hypothetical protein
LGVKLFLDKSEHAKLLAGLKEAVVVESKERRLRMAVPQSLSCSGRPENAGVPEVEKRKGLGRFFKS